MHWYMALFGKSKKEFRRGFMTLRHVVPSHDAFPAHSSMKALAARQSVRHSSGISTPCRLARSSACFSLAVLGVRSRPPSPPLPAGRPAAIWRSIPADASAAVIDARLPLSSSSPRSAASFRMRLSCLSDAGPLPVLARPRRWPGPVAAPLSSPSRAPSVSPSISATAVAVACTSRSTSSIHPLPSPAAMRSNSASQAAVVPGSTIAGARRSRILQSARPASVGVNRPFSRAICPWRTSVSTTWSRVAGVPIPPASFRWSRSSPSGRNFQASFIAVMIDPSVCRDGGLVIRSSGRAPVQRPCSPSPIGGRPVAFPAYSPSFGLSGGRSHSVHPGSSVDFPPTVISAVPSGVRSPRESVVAVKVRSAEVTVA